MNKLRDINNLTKHQLLNEVVMLKRKIFNIDLTKENNIMYFDRLCLINHRLKLIELELPLNIWEKNKFIY